MWSIFIFVLYFPPFPPTSEYIWSTKFVVKAVQNMNCKHLRIRTKKGVHYKYCILLKKEVTDECYNCINKEYKCTKFLNNCAKVSLQKKKCTIKGHKYSKITKLERNRTSIFTDDLDHCIICGNNKDNLHEIIYGKNRLNSMKYGFVIPLCFNHHVGNRGIHNNRELDLYYKRKCQEYFENNIGSRLEFIRIFGKSYL